MHLGHNICVLSCVMALNIFYRFFSVNIQKPQSLLRLSVQSGFGTQLVTHRRFRMFSTEDKINRVNQGQ